MRVHEGSYGELRTGSLLSEVLDILGGERQNGFGAEN